MKTQLSSILVFLLFALAGCSGVQTAPSDADMKFETDVDPKANFKGYKSYMWMGSASVLNDPEGLWVDPGFDANAEIKFLIDSGLRTRGMTKALTNPDVLIGFALGVNMANIEYKQNKDKSFTSLEAAPKGALVIVMVDAQTGVAIWASVASADIKGEAGDAAKERLRFAVKSMLGSIPE